MPIDELVGEVLSVFARAFCSGEQSGEGKEPGNNGKAMRTT